MSTLQYILQTLLERILYAVKHVNLYPHYVIR